MLANWKPAGIMIVMGATELLQLREFVDLVVYAVLLHSPTDISNPSILDFGSAVKLCPTKSILRFWVSSRREFTFGAPPKKILDFYMGLALSYDRQEVHCTVE